VKHSLSSPIPTPVPVAACHSNPALDFKQLRGVLGQIAGLVDFCSNRIGLCSNGPTVRLSTDAAGPGGTCGVAFALYRSGSVIPRGDS